jgi:two-component system cell cycle response regulator DivK
MALILHIEDDEAMLRLVQAVLRQAGHQIMQARHGEEGYHLAQSQAPDLILMDMWLPGEWDGWQATEKLKANPALAAIPVIALTAQGHLEAQQRAFQAGCIAYLSKPFSPQDLVALVAQHLA